MVFYNHRTCFMLCLGYAVFEIQEWLICFRPLLLRSNHSVGKILLFLVPSRHQFSQ